MTDAPYSRPNLAPLLARAVVFALMIGGCSGRQIAPPDDALTDPVVLYEAMLSRLESIESARMRATLEYYGDGRRARVEQLVLARAPAMLRIETLSPFDSTLAVFMVDGESLTFFDLQNRSYLTGPPTPRNVSRFVPFWMSAADLVQVLFGGPPLDATNPDADTYTMEWDGRAGAYRMRMPLRDSDGTLTLLVQHGSWTVSGATQSAPNGDVLFELRTGDFRTVTAGDNETQMPQRLRFVMEESDIDISLDVTQLELNVTLADRLFALPPPNGVEPVYLD